MEIPSMMGEVVALKRIAWSETGGILGIHVWNFWATAEGTNVRTEESCVDQGFARGRTCLRERFASPTSKPPTQLPTFPRRDTSLVRPAGSTPGGIRPGVGFGGPGWRCR